MIRRVAIQGFKSFEDAEFCFRSSLVVLLGPGGSGKSNLLEAFAFLKQTIISEAPFSGEEIRGTPTEMFCMHRPANEIRIVADIVSPEFPCLQYAVSVSLPAGSFSLPAVSKESLSVLKSNGTWSSVFTRDENMTIVSLPAKQGQIQLTEGGPVSRLCFIPEVASLVNEARGWYFYNLTPQQMHKPSPLGLNQIGVTGTNLASAYRYMSAQKDKYELIAGAWSTIYPHVAVETNVDSNGMVHLYFRDGKKAFPARLVSDTMLYWLAVIVAINQNARVVAIEEPSVWIAPEHLHILSEILKVASQEKQIFITTRLPLVADAIGGERISMG